MYHYNLQFSANHVYVFHSVADGQRIETELNQSGPGEAFFVSVDLTDEQAIQVKSSAGQLNSLTCLNWDLFGLSDK